MLYTLNLYSDICQLYLNKTEKKKNRNNERQNQWEYPMDEPSYFSENWQHLVIHWIRERGERRGAM